MQAIILAAGTGTRLGALTKRNTKCMVEVAGTTLIERMLCSLDAQELTRIVIVVGYASDCLKSFIATLQIATDIVYVDNPIFATTNNIYSLALAKDYLVAEDSLLLESDIIFEEDILTALIDDPRPSLAVVDKYESWMDGTVVTLDAQDHIKAFIDKPLFSFQEVDAYYKTVNLYKFSKRFSEETYVPFLDAYTRSLGTNAYYEQVLKVIAQTGNTQIGALRLEGQLWYEIDDVADLDIATTLFADATTRTDLIQRRYGGYWRYPKLLDFCYLVNPCFPPLRLIDEMKANFENLISQYPSGMEVNSLLAAKAFGIQDHNIIVGNGATELIKALMENTDGRVGFIRPTFEEYPNRYPAERSICYTPRSDDFSYTAADLQAYFEGSGIELLVLINPDNPSGNYLPHQSVLELVEWTHAQGIHLVVDESFVDFADEQDASLLNTTFLGENPHVLVVRSISKSFGVPGLRLGILASGSELLIAALKRSVSIWNINSFAEFYLQIEQKYRDDYQAALARFKELRARFLSELTELVGLRVFPTQANYVMAELVCTHTSSLLTERLLGEHAILIKDLTPKLTVQGDSAQPARQFIRLAIRSDEDNRLLIEALRSCL